MLYSFEWPKILTISKTFQIWQWIQCTFEGLKANSFIDDQKWGKNWNKVRLKESQNFKIK